MRVMRKLVVLATLAGALGFATAVAPAASAEAAAPSAGESAASRAHDAHESGCTFNHMTGFVWCY